MRRGLHERPPGPGPLLRRAAHTDDFRFSPSTPTTYQLSLNGVQVDQDIDQPVWGFANKHAHPANRLGFGGKSVKGDTDGPMETALSNGQCTDHNGGFAVWNDRAH